MRLASMCLLSAMFGCSSSNFEVAAPADAAVETTGDASSPEDTTVDDAIVEDTKPPPMSDAPCSPLGSPLTIFVDARATRASVGSAECPARTIAEGLAIAAGLAPAKRTIRIAGTTGTPLIYNETAVLNVKPSTAIVGTGSSQVVVTGGGVCKTTTCLFVLEGATSIEGLTINAGGAVGLALGPAATTVSIARNLVVTGGTNAASVAIYVNGLGAVEIGPEVRAKDNAGVGLAIEAAVSAKVINSTFNDNLGGIVVSGGPLTIEGASTLRNKNHGVSLLSNAKHTISNLDARDNVGNGVNVDTTASLTLRTSTLVKNRIGLVFRFGATNQLDLGTFEANGGNLFGGKSALNSKAAICLPHARNAKAPAVGNKWFVCDPTRIPLLGGATCEGISTYQDVYFAPFEAGSGPPLDWSGCSEGP